MIPNMALRWSGYDARSYDLPVERRYDTLWRRAVKDGAATETATTGATLTASSLPAFRLMGVTSIAQDPEEPRVEAPRLPITYDGEDLRIYANPGALPRVGVVAAQTVVEDEEAELAAVLDPEFDGRRSLVTSSPLPGLPARAAPGPVGRAAFVSEEPERLVVEAVARRRSALVLADLHYPGWHATVGGREVELRRVNYLLRGVLLPPGRHRVVFSYEPITWRIGWIASLVALVGLVVAVAVGLRGRRSATS
jgi:hypothetical protein